MKRTIAVLLALCFLLSVTAGAAGAARDGVTGPTGNHTNNGPGPAHDNNGPKDNDKPKKDNDKPKVENCFKKVWVKGFWEKIVVKKVVFKHGHKVVVKEIIKKWHPGHWKKIAVPCKFHDHR